MRVLVTGAKGQLGRELARADWPAVASPTFMGRAELDITSSVSAFFDKLVPDVVINAAAFARVDDAEKDPAAANAVNRDGPARLAEACRERGAVLVHLSTDQVFGKGRGPHTESAPTVAVNAYAASKIAGERSVRERMERCFIIRTAWLMSLSGRNFVSHLLRVGADAGELQLVTRRSNPTPAFALARFLIDLCTRIDRVPFGTYHFAGVPAASLFDVAQAIFAARGRRNVPRIVAVGQRAQPEAGRPEDSTLDCSLVASALGLPAPDWRAALPEILQRQ